VESTSSPFTSSYRKGEIVKIPIAHAEGRYVLPDEMLVALNRSGRIAFRFCDEQGNVTTGANPNGAAENITGVLSKKGNVLAMMPHPERASEGILGSEDGKKLFDSMARHIERME
jgi:phosphoribosylformylglycinamidine synthase